MGGRCSTIMALLWHCPLITFFPNSSPLPPLQRKFTFCFIIGRCLLQRESFFLFVTAVQQCSFDHARIKIVSQSALQVFQSPFVSWSVPKASFISLFLFPPDVLLPLSLIHRSTFLFSSAHNNQIKL